MPSHRANAYGTAVEYKMAEQYNLDLARSSWKDADGPGGIPHEIKAAMHQHADDQPGTFKIYRAYHEKLQEQSGYCVFAAYRRRGKGIQVLTHGRRHASRLPSIRWHGGGDHRGTKQAKIAISDVL